MGQLIRVPMAGMGIGKEGDQLFTVLGSCIAIMLYDNHQKIGGMIHVMLGYIQGRNDSVTKYADSGIPFLQKEMVRQGAHAHRLVGAKITGGGEMFDVFNQDNNVSQNNIIQIKEILNEMKIHLIAEDCGGNDGRRVTFDITTGKVRIETQNQSDIFL